MFHPCFCEAEPRAFGAFEVMGGKPVVSFFKDVHFGENVGATKRLVEEHTVFDIYNFILVGADDEGGRSIGGDLLLKGE